MNARSAILDGELVVFDDDGRPQLRARAAQRRRVGPPGRPPVLRRAAGRRQRHDRPAVSRLDGGCSNSSSSPGDELDGAVVPDRRRRRTGGGDRRAGARRRDREAPRLDAIGPVRARRTGARSRTAPLVELTIGGFTAGTGNRADTFGALLVGRPHAASGCAFAGGVGTGFDQRTLRVARRPPARLGRRRVSVRPAAACRGRAHRHVGRAGAARAPSRSPSSPTTASSATPASSTRPVTSADASVRVSGA